MALAPTEVRCWGKGSSGRLLRRADAISLRMHVANWWSRPYIDVQDGRRSMTNRQADDMLEGLVSRYYHPVPYWRMGEGESEQAVTVGGSA